MQAMGAARHVACYQRWIAGQEAGLGELEASSANAAAGRATDGELRAVVERCMRGYAEYVSTRRALAREDGAALFAPPWCTSFENSVLWIGGCRPSLTIRLLYSLSGEGLEEHIEEFISGRGALGAARGMGLLGITARQLELVNDLHRRTLRDEDALSDRLATLQEDVADRPLLPIVRERATAAAAALVQAPAATAWPRARGSWSPHQKEPWTTRWTRRLGGTRPGWAGCWRKPTSFACRRRRRW